MNRLISALLVLTFVALSSVPLAYAGPRYPVYSGRYYPVAHYRAPYPYRGHHHHDSARFLAPLGIGLLAGAVIGSVLYQPPPPPRVVYVPPPVIVPANPVYVGQRTSVPPPAYDTILRQVKPTVQVLNVRSGPGLEEEVIGQATLGEVLGVIGAAPEWLYVKTGTGQYGWVMTQYTQELSGPLG